MKGMLKAVRTIAAKEKIIKLRDIVVYSFHFHFRFHFYPQCTVIGKRMHPPEDEYSPWSSGQVKHEHAIYEFSNTKNEEWCPFSLGVYLMIVFTLSLLF
jgi:hypothetical protein